MNGVLLTHSSAEYAELSDLTEPSKIKWCQRWGWRYVRVETPVIDCWHRPMIWRQQLQNCDRLFFMGADAMITNTEIPPIESGKELVLAADGNGINSDVFFMDHTSGMMELLLALIRYDKKQGSNEQEAMSVLLSRSFHYPHFVSHLGEVSKGEKLQFGGAPCSQTLLFSLNKMFKSFSVEVVEQRRLNAYPQALYGRTGNEDYGWQPGDFVLHLPGVPMEERIRFIGQVLAQ